MLLGFPLARIDQRQNNCLKCKWRKSSSAATATAMRLAREAFQDEEEPMDALQTLEKSLQSTPFAVSEDQQIIRITQSKSGEQLVVEINIGGCHGCDVLNTYLENLKPSVEQAKTTHNMIGKFKGAAFWSGETIPTDTEITQLSNGSLSGRYVAHPKGKAPAPGVLRQIGVLNGRQVQFKCDDQGTNDGFLRVTFGDNFGNFDGQFSEEADFSNSLKWTGKRLR